MYLPKNRNLSKILLLDDECVAAQLLAVLSTMPRYEKPREREHPFAHLIRPRARRFRRKEGIPPPSREFSGTRKASLLAGDSCLIARKCSRSVIVSR
jgi:hypothetical protein